jgi:pSer/pThr/pTyr-binding forkhead associated (FHA) protein
MSALVVIHGKDRGRFFNVPKEAALVLGRDESLLARLHDPSVSRRHLEFIHHETDGKCYAVDLQSRNGARINRERLNHSQELRDGDVIHFGHTLVVFVNKTLDAQSPIKTFLNACEKLYAEDLKKIRDHEAKRAAAKAEANEGSMSGRTGVLNFGSIFGKKVT